MGEECKGTVVPVQSPTENERLLLWLHAEAAFKRDRLQAEVGRLEDQVDWYLKMGKLQLRWVDESAEELERARVEIDRLRREVEFWAHSIDIDWDATIFAIENHGRTRELCACISDDQASQLGPGFSRPVCAVHPEVESL